MGIHWLLRMVLVGVILTASAVSGGATQTITLTVEADQTKPISTDLIGIFFEDINYAADGGLYAELVQNRSFNYQPTARLNWNAFTAWELVTRGGGRGSVDIDESLPIHPNNPRYVVLHINQVGSGVGLSNAGYGGIAIRAREKYNFSMFSRQLYMESRWNGPGIEAGPMPLVVRLEDRNGRLLSDELSLEVRGGNWKKISGVLTANQTHDSARLVVLAMARGGITVDVVSLFPQQTFRNRPNGLRADLAQTLADMKPRFMRFPGGCVAHGNGLNNMYRWKDTIGPIEQRREQSNIWGYHQSVGLGYFEYFQFCMDIGAEPIPVVPAGVSCQNSSHQTGGTGQQAIPMDEMDEYVQEVLDLIEWANGPATSQWGAKRAAAGRAEPFGLKYLAVGNEDLQTPEFLERFKMIHDAVKAKHPEITVIGNVGPFPDGEDFEIGWAFAREHDVEMVAEHYYRDPAWYWNNLDRYDHYDRSEAKVFVSEYAAHDTGRRTTLRSALAEAAYMTGLERNADIVHMACYAPLFGKVGNTQWNPDLIYFTNTEVIPTINYHVQKLYGNNAGDTYLPTTVKVEGTAQDDTPVRNGVILGTWETQARFDDLKIARGTETVLDESFERAVQDWNMLSGQWRVENGAYAQRSARSPALSMFAFDDDHTDYTVTLRAMKTGGNEGFLIGFGAIDENNYYWLNLGGWDNTRHQVEKTVDGNRSAIGPSVSGSIETNRWYEIRIHVTGQRIRCWLDGELIITLTDRGFEDAPDFAASTVRDSATGDVIVKLVSMAASPRKAVVDLRSVGTFNPKAVCTVLSGNPMDENRPGREPAVLPKVSQIAVSQVFDYQMPPHSLSIIRLSTR